MCKAITEDLLNYGTTMEEYGLKMYETILSILKSLMNKCKRVEIYWVIRYFKGVSRKIGASLVHYWGF